MRRQNEESSQRHSLCRYKNTFIAYKTDRQPVGPVSGSSQWVQSSGPTRGAGVAQRSRRGAFRRVGTVMGIVVLMSNNPRRTPIALPQRPCPRTGRLLYLRLVHQLDALQTLLNELLVLPAAALSVQLCTSRRIGSDSVLPVGAGGSRLA